MAPWIESNNHVMQNGKKTAERVKKSCLPPCETTNRINCEELNVPLRFLVCFSSSYGGHICKNHRTCFYEKLEFFRLLKVQPYLFKLGRNRLRLHCCLFPALLGFELFVRCISTRVSSCDGSASFLTTHDDCGARYTHNGYCLTEPEATCMGSSSDLKTSYSALALSWWRGLFFVYSEPCSNFIVASR